MSLSPPAACPHVSIVIPTRGRADYLDAALASVAPQASLAPAEVIVVTDGEQEPSAAVTRRRGARLVSLREPTGANAARNAGVRAARGELIVFLDDDIEAPAGWLAAILDGTAAAPGMAVFGGPIRAVIHGGGPRACGREPAPITTLDLGPVDRDVELVWSANMAIRRRALDWIGPFDESLAGCGEEEDWLRRWHAAGGRVRYLAAAAVQHHRSAPDARLRALCATAYGRGRAARRYDVHKGTTPALAAELRTLAGCAGHAARRRCAIGVVVSFHSAGRLLEGLLTLPLVEDRRRARRRSPISPR
ncbi:MAG: glycosyltransferase family 2 protein [Solirubrobacteraceae bacterium]